MYDKPALTDHRYEAIYDEVMGLPTKYRIVIYLFYYEGYSIKEIAEIVRKNQNTVKTNLSRGKKLLRDILGEE